MKYRKLHIGKTVLKNVKILINSPFRFGNEMIRVAKHFLKRRKYFKKFLVKMVLVSQLQHYLKFINTIIVYVISFN